MTFLTDKLFSRRQVIVATAIAALTLAGCGPEPSNNQPTPPESDPPSWELEGYGEGYFTERQIAHWEQIMREAGDSYMNDVFDSFDMLRLPSPDLRGTALSDILRNQTQLAVFPSAGEGYLAKITTRWQGKAFASPYAAGISRNLERPNVEIYEADIFSLNPIQINNSLKAEPPLVKGWALAKEAATFLTLPAHIQIARRVFDNLYTTTEQVNDVDVYCGFALQNTGIITKGIDVSSMLWTIGDVLPAYYVLPFVHKQRNNPTFASSHALAKMVPNGSPSLFDHTAHFERDGILLPGPDGNYRWAYEYTIANPSTDLLNKLGAIFWNRSVGTELENFM